ncbi:MAG: hypothetical protein IT442_04025 [Phycisphaeraceae bacterium]|nr:hypothetical protein [Phycisphaeraceae bacterium]
MVSDVVGRLDIIPGVPGGIPGVRCFTFEVGVRWGERLCGVQLAEAKGGKWGWRLWVDEVGSLIFEWWCGEYRRNVRGEIAFDLMRVGTWYQAAAVLHDRVYTGEPYAEEGSFAAVYLTERGAGAARCVGVVQGFGTPGEGVGEELRLVVGDVSEPRHGNAWACQNVDIKGARFSLGGRLAGDLGVGGERELPGGVVIEAGFEEGSLGRAFAVGDGTIVFSPAVHGHCMNDWFGFRVRGARGKTLRFRCPGASWMMMGPCVSEDGGATWGRPSGGTMRRTGVGHQGLLEFSQAFTSDEAIVAASPIVSVGMAEQWMREVAERYGGRVHDLGASPAGRALRAVEIGNPDAAAIYLQAGQHSMAERVGFHVMAGAIEEAGRDAELLEKTRWIVLPVVNVDSYLVMPREGDPNMNRVWDPRKSVGEAHPTVGAVMRFLEREAKKTGVAAAMDFHSGGVWRGHTILAMESAEDERFDTALGEAGLRWGVRRRRWTGEGEHPATFTHFTAGLAGMRVAYIVELALLASVTEEGAVATSVGTLREDGKRLCRAVKKWGGWV